MLQSRTIFRGARREGLRIATEEHQHEAIYELPVLASCANTLGEKEISCYYLFALLYLAGALYTSSG